MPDEFEEEVRASRAVIKKLAALPDVARQRVIDRILEKWPGTDDDEGPFS